MEKKIILSAALTCTLAVAGAQAKSPNVVLILADDMGYGDVNALNPDSQVPTPNLDRLRAQGMAFTDAHSGSSLSTPSRYGIMTGRYCFRSPLKNGVLNGFSPMLIEPETATMAEMLHDNGYNTAVIGKWHIGLDWQKKDPNKKLTKGKGFLQDDSNVDYAAGVANGPHTRGFDYSYVLPGSLDMSPYLYVENGRVADPNLIAVEGRGSLTDTGPDRRVFWRDGTASASFDFYSVLDNFADRAVSYIAEADADTPFFLYHPITAPHTPWLPAKEYQGRSGAGLYGDFICHLDDIVGRIMATLEERGMADNTILIFTSDNGAFWDDIERQNSPLHSANHIYRGMKADAWDGGHRIPLLVRWPEAVAAGSTSEQLVCLTDIMATAAEANDSPMPASAEDSRSFLAALQGQTDYDGMRQSVVHHSGPGMFAIRRGEWKFIDGQGSGGRSTEAQDVPEAPGQLYNMKKDPSETTNLYLKQTKIVDELRTELEQLKTSGK